jgi:hypothetical protein
MYLAPIGFYILTSFLVLLVPSLSHVTTHFVHLDRIAVRLDRPNNILNMSTVHSVHHLVGFNINYLEPNLYHSWAGVNHNSSVSHFPILIILKYTSIHILPNFLNGCFLFSAYTAA